MSEAERAGTSRQETRQDKNERRLLAGRYRLGDVLGRGGMGTVWRAEDETLGRTVAVKELRFPSNIDEEEKRRLITRTLREAKAIARIRNNSAVTVFDVVDEDDRPWIVMELVEGKSLAEVIREDGLLEPKRAAEVGLAILDVLRSAHREGILHRDVKPSNVLIAEDGRVVLTDFGIAQVEGDPSITSTGMLVGAPSYISPERARGHKPGPAADLWSLGGLLYAAVEGTPPYDKGSAIATLTAVMTEPLEEPKNAGPLRDVIYGLLTKDPAKRLDDAGARAMLNAVIHAPEPEPLDATRVVPLPVPPGGPEGKRGEEAGEKLRGALRSVRKAAGAATGAATARGKSGSEPGARGAGGAVSGGARPGVPGVPGARPGAAGVSTGSAGGSGARPGGPVPGAAGAPNSSANKAASGWPVVPPPDLDLPPRPVPRAPLTDVVPKRTLVVIAVVVVLAVLGTVLAFALNGDDGESGNNGAKAVSSAGASTKRDKDTGSGTDTGKRTDGTSTASVGTGAGSAPTADSGESGSDDDADSHGDAESSGSAGSKDGGSAPVVSTRKGGQGYSIGLPKGWKYRSNGSAGDRYTGPGGQKLLVAWTGSPKDDPVADWKYQERYMVRSQYHKIRIEQVDYRGWNTADWEFTYVEGGTKYRTIDRGFVVNDHLGYALMYTAKSADWDGELRKDTWKTLTKSFEPKS
ncbi:MULTISPECIES: serine/threonine-protein kinase [Streptomyces]|uniref:non-specific serine/threonine protein kinase n=1 Tax=Streptomyces bangladeshensis TaxID=295352 RepID=A0ABP5NUX5_9ACTN|nr:serine/threonine-protein kinase [Streptomyces sp. EAS-AB2608]BCM68925.1 putative serine/threonine protein kinase [Streptomyces sp. EAS-AB2608]